MQRLVNVAVSLMAYFHELLVTCYLKILYQDEFNECTSLQLAGLFLTKSKIVDLTSFESRRFVIKHDTQLLWRAKSDYVVSVVCADAEFKYTIFYYVSFVVNSNEMFSFDSHVNKRLLIWHNILYQFVSTFSHKYVYCIWKLIICTTS